MEYLGHIVTPQGVKVDQGKIKAMLDWPRPTNISELRGFLGLTGYYRKFVRNYGILARPLTNLLKKGQFGWTKEADVAFQALKIAMTSTPTVAMPNFNELFVIESDASGDGIGAVLTQQGKPIAFMSRALGVSKRSWSTYAREMLAIIQAIQTWRPYLLGLKFYIQTDHCSLKYLLEQRIATSEQQKWVAKLLGYNYEIIYKPGRDVQYQVGDLVYVKLHPYRQHSVFRRACEKLARRFYGPYLIEQKIGPVAYKIQLPEGSKLHPVFHVSMLKKKVGDTRATNADLPLMDDDGEPERSLDTCWVKRGSRFVEESLVKWKHMPMDDATWENIHELQDRFFNLNLGDKVPMKEGGIDKPRRSQRVPVKNTRFFA